MENYNGKCIDLLYLDTGDVNPVEPSIPYFLENGYEIIMDEYQVILRKTLNL
jgi:hypothetical protein